MKFVIFKWAKEGYGGEKISLALDLLRWLWNI